MSDIALTFGPSGGDIGVGTQTLTAPYFEVGASGCGDDIGGAEWNVTLLDDIQRDEGLKTAVFLSLFTDRRAEDGDELPDAQTDRRGWWGDEFSTVDNDRIGSRLWLLDRSKKLAAILSDAKTYAVEALQWMIDDGVSDAIDVATAFVGNFLALTVTIHRPQVDPVSFRFNYAWLAQGAM